MGYRDRFDPDRCGNCKTTEYYCSLKVLCTNPEVLRKNNGIKPIRHNSNICDNHQRR